MLGELTQSQIKYLLSSQIIGRLGFADENQPYILPVTYVYNGEYIYGQSNVGEKLNIIRKNPKICFEVDLLADMRNWQSALVIGKFEELNDEEAIVAREILFNRVFTLMTSDTVHKNEYEPSGKLDEKHRYKDIMYRINILQMTGRFERL